ncbi:MAG: hypothetical protein EBY39_15055 [Flavobacteriia bacterium]|nr:hypothetical protein [Flavobacteriia bacterium]
MSHFYSSIQGGRGKATRCGHKSTGIRGMVRTHDLTLNVSGENEGCVDTFTVNVTIDNPSLQITSGDRTSDANLIYPLKLVIDKERGTVDVQHTVGHAESHNVRSCQADFMHILEEV